MSPTSYRAAPPRDTCSVSRCENRYLSAWPLTVKEINKFFERASFKNDCQSLKPFVGAVILHFTSQKYFCSGQRFSVSIISLASCRSNCRSFFSFHSLRLRLVLLVCIHIPPRSTPRRLQTGPRGAKLRLSAPPCVLQGDPPHQILRMFRHAHPCSGRCHCCCRFLYLFAA